MKHFHNDTIVDQCDLDVVNPKPHTNMTIDQMSSILANGHTYTARLKSAEAMIRDIPRERLGWWYELCPGDTLPNLRAATKRDLARCILSKDGSQNPAHYLCENIPNGSLITLDAVAVLTRNQ